MRAISRAMGSRSWLPAPGTGPIVTSRMSLYCWRRWSKRPRSSSRPAANYWGKSGNRGLTPISVTPFISDAVGADFRVLDHLFPQPVGLAHDHGWGRVWHAPG